MRKLFVILTAVITSISTISYADPTGLGEVAVTSGHTTAGPAVKVEIRGEAARVLFNHLQEVSGSTAPSANDYVHSRGLECFFRGAEGYSCISMLDTEGDFRKIVRGWIGVSN